MSRHIYINSLNPKEINKAIDELNKYRDGVVSAVKEVAKLLAEDGVKVAELEYNSAYYDGENFDVEVSMKEVRVTRQSATYSITASGKTVCFIEFGTGIYNDTSYPIPKPDGVVNAGEYDLTHDLGKHLISYGTLHMWHDEDGNERTGNDANRCLYHTILELERDVFYLIQKAMDKV